MMTALPAQLFVYLTANKRLVNRIALMLITVLTSLPVHAQVCTPIEIAKILATDGTAGDWFGLSVSISNDTAVIGAPLDTANGFQSGSVYVFTRINEEWFQQAKLLPTDGTSGALFGISVSISDNTVIVGAIMDAGNGLGSGSSYIFKRTGSQWAQQAKLFPLDGEFWDQFGMSVSINGETAIVGANLDDDNDSGSGSAYVFKRSGGVWIQQAKLLPIDGIRDGNFGKSVAISGDTVVIGATGSIVTEHDLGSAYVFVRNLGVWTQQSKLVATDGAMGDLFGTAVSIHGDAAVIGAYKDDDSGLDSGSAYIFSRSGNQWIQQAKLLPSDGVPEAIFGCSVSISENIALIGAMGNNENGFQAGAAYIYISNGGVWTQQAKALPSDGAEYDSFGFSVSISSDIPLVGAYLNEDNGYSSGSAYIFDLGCTVPCLPDLTGDGTLDFFDVSDFLLAFGAGDLIADFNGDGSLDFFDVSDFLLAFATGCP